MINFVLKGTLNLTEFSDNRKFANGALNGTINIAGNNMDVLANLDYNVITQERYATITIQPQMTNNLDDFVYIWIGKQVLTINEFSSIYSNCVEIGSNEDLAQVGGTSFLVNDNFSLKSTGSHVYGSIELWHNGIDLSIVSINSRTSAVSTYYTDYYGLSCSSRVDIVELGMNALEKFDYGYISGFNTLTPYSSRNELNLFASAIADLVGLIKGGSVASIIGGIFINLVTIPGVGSTDFSSVGSATDAHVSHDFGIAENVNLDTAPMIQDFRLATSVEGEYSFRGHGKLSYITYISSQGTPHPSIQRTDIDLNTSYSNLFIANR